MTPARSDTSWSVTPRVRRSIAVVIAARTIRSRVAAVESVRSRMTYRRLAVDVSCGLTGPSERLEALWFQCAFTRNGQNDQAQPGASPMR